MLPILKILHVQLLLSELLALHLEAMWCVCVQNMPPYMTFLRLCFEKFNPCFGGLMTKIQMKPGPCPYPREFSFYHLFSHPYPFLQSIWSNFSRKDAMWSTNLLEGKCLILVWTGEERIDCCSTFQLHKATDKTDNIILENLVSNNLRKVSLPI